MNKKVFKTHNLYWNYCSSVQSYTIASFALLYLPFSAKCTINIYTKCLFVYTAEAALKNKQTHRDSRILSNSNLSSQTSLFLPTFFKTMLKMFKFLLLLCLLSLVEGGRGGSLFICIGDPLPLWLWLWLSSMSIIIIIFADSAQTEYCSTIHCPSEAWQLTFLTYIKG